MQRAEQIKQTDLPGVDDFGSDNTAWKAYVAKILELADNDVAKLLTSWTAIQQMAATFPWRDFKLPVILRILAVMPVSTATGRKCGSVYTITRKTTVFVAGERSFSALRQIKTYLWSSMGSDRNTSLNLLCFNDVYVDSTFAAESFLELQGRSEKILFERWSELSVFEKELKNPPKVIHKEAITMEYGEGHPSPRHSSQRQVGKTIKQRLDIEKLFWLELCKQWLNDNGKRTFSSWLNLSSEDIVCHTKSDS